MSHIYHCCENKLYFDGMMLMSALYQTNTLSLSLLVRHLTRTHYRELALFLCNAACLMKREKYQCHSLWRVIDMNTMKSLFSLRACCEIGFCEIVFIDVHTHF